MLCSVLACLFGLVPALAFAGEGDSSDVAPGDGDVRLIGGEGETAAYLRTLAEVLQSVAAWLKGVSKLPVADWELRYENAVRLATADRFEEARAGLEELVDEAPNRVRAHSQLGYVYLRLDDLESARAVLERALALDPDNVVVINNLAYVYIEGEIDLARGIAMARQIVATDPTHPAFLNTLGRGLHKSSHYEEAAAALEEALAYKERLKRTEDWATLHYHLARVYQAMDRNQAAFDEASAALALDPEHPRAPALVAELE